MNADIWDTRIVQGIAVVNIATIECIVVGSQAGQSLNCLSRTRMVMPVVQEFLLVCLFLLHMVIIKLYIPLKQIAIDHTKLYAHTGHKEISNNIQSVSISSPLLRLSCLDQTEPCCPLCIFRISAQGSKSIGKSAHLTIIILLRVKSFFINFLCAVRFMLTSEKTRSATALE